MKPPTPWWHGARGEWYVVMQMGLLALVAFGPPHWPGGPAWPAVGALVGRWAGVALVVWGAGLALAGTWHLGANLTPLPHPKDEATFVQSGAYALVRHPIYSGLIAAALGWALWQAGTLTLLYALLLFGFFDIKSRREERWLAAKFAEYAAYQKRVKKLLPGLY